MLAIITGRDGCSEASDQGIGVMNYRLCIKFAGAAFARTGHLVRTLLANVNAGDAVPADSNI